MSSQIEKLGISHFYTFNCFLNTTLRAIYSFNARNHKFNTTLLDFPSP